jgi:hypothetical protein
LVKHVLLGRHEATKKQGIDPGGIPESGSQPTSSLGRRA